MGGWRDTRAKKARRILSQSMKAMKRPIRVRVPIGRQGTKATMSKHVNTSSIFVWNFYGVEDATCGLAFVAKSVGTHLMVRNVVVI